MFSENVPNGDQYAVGVAVFAVVLYTFVLSYNMYVEWNNQTPAYWTGYIVASIVGLFVGYFVLKWFLMLYFMPGNVIWKVTPPDDSVVIIQVLSSRLTIAGVASALLMKFSRKEVVSAEKKEVEEEEYTDVSIQAHNLE